MARIKEQNRQSWKVLIQESCLNCSSEKREASVFPSFIQSGLVARRIGIVTTSRAGIGVCIGSRRRMGHDAQLMPAKYVRPYSKGQKNDFRD